MDEYNQTLSPLVKRQRSNDLPKKIQQSKSVSISSYNSASFEEGSRSHFYENTDFLNSTFQGLLTYEDFSCHGYHPTPDCMSEFMLDNYNE